MSKFNLTLDFLARLPGDCETVFKKTVLPNHELLPSPEVHKGTKWASQFSYETMESRPTNNSSTTPQIRGRSISFLLPEPTDVGHRKGLHHGSPARHRRTETGSTTVSDVSVVGRSRGASEVSPVRSRLSSRIHSGNPTGRVHPPCHPSSKPLAQWPDIQATRSPTNHTLHAGTRGIQLASNSACGFGHAESQARLRDPFVVGVQASSSFRTPIFGIQLHRLHPDFDSRF